MVFIDQSVLPVALPTIQKQLHATNVQLEWAVNSYLLVTAVLVLAGGKVGDLIGHRLAFCLGIMVFAVASALCGVSPSAGWLVGSRALQGVGAALMFPASSALIMSLFPQKERGKATGINVSMSSLFLIIGPLVGGYLTEQVSWRWIFWINLPLALFGFVFVLCMIPKSQRVEGRMDLWGFLAFMFSCSFLVVLVMQGREWGWLSAESGYLLVLFLICAGLLIWRELRSKHPFLDLGLFKHPIFRAVNISVFTTQFILMITVFRAIYFQDVLEWSPVKAGVVTVLSSFPVLFMSPIGGILSDKWGPKLPITVGFLLLIFSFFWLAFFPLGSLSLLLIGLFPLGLGIPLVLTPSYSSAMGAVPPMKAGSAFGTLSTVRSLGASLGVAMIGSLIDNVQFSSLTRLVQSNPVTQSTDPALIQQLSLGVPGAWDKVAQLPANVADALGRYMVQAEVSGFFYSHVALGLALAIAFVCVFILYHRRSTHHLPETPAEGYD